MGRQGSELLWCCCSSGAGALGSCCAAVLLVMTAVAAWTRPTAFSVDGGGAQTRTTQGLALRPSSSRRTRKKMMMMTMRRRLRLSEGRRQMHPRSMWRWPCQAAVAIRRCAAAAERSRERNRTPQVAALVAAVVAVGALLLMSFARGKTAPRRSRCILVTAMLRCCWCHRAPFRFVFAALCRLLVGGAYFFLLTKRSMRFFLHLDSNNELPENAIQSDYSSCLCNFRGFFMSPPIVGSLFVFRHSHSLLLCFLLVSSNVRCVDS